MKRYVCGFAFQEQGTQVLLIHKLHPENQKGRLNGIGGKIEKDETPHQAMVREFHEEAGASLPDWTLFAKLWDGISWEVYFFRINYDGAVSNMTDEKIEWCFCDELPLKCLSNLSFLIEMAQETHSEDWPYSIIERDSVLLRELCCMEGIL